MKHISFSAIAIGGGMFALILVQSASGNPPFSFGEAFVLAACIVTLSAIGGFELGFACLVIQAMSAVMFREAWNSALWLVVIAIAWYAGATLLAARGSRVLMGISAGVLFAGCLAERMPTFTLSQWLVFLALFVLEVSGMYFVSNGMRGRWFSPYA